MRICFISSVSYTKLRLIENLVQQDQCLVQLSFARPRYVQDIQLNLKTKKDISFELKVWVQYNTIYQFPAMRGKLQLSFFSTFIVHSFSHRGTDVIHLHNTESIVTIVCTTMSWSSLVFAVHVYREDTIGGIIGVNS